MVSAIFVGSQKDATPRTGFVSLWLVVWGAFLGSDHVKQQLSFFSLFPLNILISSLGENKTEKPTVDNLKEISTYI